MGRELVRQLAALEDDVHVFVRSEPPAGVPGVWLKGEITREETIQGALGDHKFDTIYHLASLPRDTGNPVQMVTTNLLGLTNMLVYARDMQVGRFVLASTMAVYEWRPATDSGPPDYVRGDEEYPTRPREMYASTKWAQEILAMTFYHQYGLPVTVLRIAMVVGPGGIRDGQPPHRHQFVQQLAKGKSIQIPRFSPNELHHFVDLRDVARMHIVAGEHPDVVGEIFNCCGPVPSRGPEFSTAIQHVVPGIKVETSFLLRGTAVAHSMSKAKRLIGFEPQYSLVDSLQSIVDWVNAGGLVEEWPE